MKKTTWILLIIVCIATGSNSLFAQRGWQWGISSVPMHNSGADAWASASDDSMNVIVAGLTPIISGGSIAPYIVYGSDTVFNTGPHQQGIIVKADSGGHFKWARGSQGADNWPYGVCADHAGNIYLFGSYYDFASCSFGSITLSNPSLYYMYYLVKYSPTGNVIWAQNVAGNTRILNAGAIGIDTENNIYVTGGFDQSTVSLGGFTLTNSSASGDTFDIFVAKYNTSGTVVAASAYGGRLDDFPFAMTVSPSGALYITGLFRSRVLTIGGSVLTDTFMVGAYPQPLTFLMKADSNTHALWAKKEPKKVTINGLSLDNTEHILIAGQMDSTVIMGSDTLVSAGNGDILVAKLDSAGNVIWAKRAGDVYGQEAWNIISDQLNNIWVAGGTSSASGAFSFDGHSIPVPSSCFDPSFLVKYSSAGVYDTGFMMRSGGDDYLNIFNSGNNLYLIGDYTNMSLIFGPDTLTPFMTMEEEIFIARYRTDSIHGFSDTSSTLGNLPLTIAHSAIVIAPNPAGGVFSINGLNVASSLEVFNLMGEKIFSRQGMMKKEETIDISNQPSGVYFVVVMDADGIITSKVLKQ